MIVTYLHGVVDFELFIGRDDEEEGWKYALVPLLISLPPVIGNTLFASLRVFTNLQSSWSPVKSILVLHSDSKCIETWTSTAALINDSESS